MGSVPTLPCTEEQVDRWWGEQEPTWCSCDERQPEIVDVPSRPGGPDLHCILCGGIVPCELCDCFEVPQKGATAKHIDYLTCDEHFDRAVDLVASRRW